MSTTRKSVEQPADTHPEPEAVIATAVQAATNGATPPPDADTAAAKEGVDFSQYEYTLGPVGGGKVVNLTLPLVKKLKQDEFVRVDPRPEMRRVLALVEAEAGFDVEFYAPSREVQQALGSRRVKPFCVFTCCSRVRGTLLWAIPSPNPTHRSKWHSTAWAAAKQAETQWVSLEANESGTGYDAIVAVNQQVEPSWSGKSLDELLALALEDRYITDINHPIFQLKRGEL